MLGPRTFGFGRVIPQVQQLTEDPAIAAARERMRGTR
jgi:hypothetical protein